MNIKKQKIAVACTNASGEADLIIVEVEVSEDDFGLGKHYDLAKNDVEEQGYESPFVCFDESEQRNIHRVYPDLAK